MLHRSPRPATSLSLALAFAAFAPVALAADPKPLPDADEVVKDLDVADGYMKLYYRKQQQGRREPPVKMYAEIPMREIGQPFMLATSFSGGTTYAGWQWSEQLLAWERHGEDKLVLIERDVRYRADAGGPLADVVKRTYSDRVVKAVPIVGEGRRGENRGLLIDAKELFADSAALFFGFGNMLDHSVARFEKFKSFPNNTELAITMPTRAGGQLTTLHYSLSRVPRTDYQPRLADDRIGYFLTAIKDFSKGRPEDDRFLRFVNRWDLQKADPSLKISPPKRSIVFYVEKTVPIRFRRFVREGILEWNKAFEKIGFTEAIVVRQQTDDNEFKDLDPEDQRYNFFRWITSERSFAMGPSRVNPTTGEIIDADIIFDDSMVRWFLRDYEEMIKKSPEVFFSPRSRRFFGEVPDAHPFAGTRFAEAAKAPVADEAMPRPEALRASCEYGDGIAHELSLAGLLEMVQGDAAKGGAPKAAKGDFPEEFIGAIIKEVVMHEVGHTLGLRHNFKASTWLTLKEINAVKGTATVGSVMDYNPVNVAPPGETQGEFITGTLGPYDFWAIEYGYRPVEKDDELKAIATRVAEKGLAYATDEDTWSPDPLVNRWDLGQDPLDFARSRLELVNALLPTLVKRVVAEGEGYQRARRALDMLLYEYMRSATFASRFVGGQYAHRDHKGDPNERAPLVVVETAKQREALKLVCERVFAEGAIVVPPELARYLAAGRWSHWGNDDWMDDVNYPLHERILTIQRSALAQLMTPERFEAVHDGELKLGEDEDALTLPEVLATLTGSIFTEIQPAKGAEGRGGLKKPAGAPTLRKPVISSVRRSLQRAYVTNLITIVVRSRYGSAPQVTRALAHGELRGIKEGVERVMGSGIALDPYTQAHFEETIARITKALDASYQVQ